MKLKLETIVTMVNIRRVDNKLKCQSIWSFRLTPEDKQVTALYARPQCLVSKLMTFPESLPSTQIPLFNFWVLTNKIHPANKHLLQNVLD